MKKKLLSMLLCVILTLMLLPVTALADGAEAKDGDFNGTIEWNAEDVSFKGSTPFVIANGTAQTPRFTVKAADGTVVAPENYTYAYQENTAAGTGYVTVKLSGAYSGTLRGWFKIYLPATTKTAIENTEDGIMLSWTPVEGAAGYVIYRRAWNLVDAGWTTFERWNNTTELTWTDTAVYAGTRYQYGVKAYFERRTDPVSGAQIGGNVGDNFNLGMVGPLKTTVHITTRTLNSITPNVGQLTVKWSGSKVFTGYQLKYATDANFTKNVNLKKDTVYYVTIRSYQEFEGMTYFGGWSNVKHSRVSGYDRSKADLVFDTTTFDGKKLNSADVAKYDLVMVNYWAEWCGPCMWELPFIQQIHEEYPNVLIIGVWIGYDRAEAKAKLSELGITYPIIAPSGTLLTEYRNRSMYIPFTFFFNNSGMEIDEMRVGAEAYDTWKSIVNKLLP